MRSIPDNLRRPADYWPDWNPASIMFNLNGTEFKILVFVGYVCATLRRRYVDVTVTDLTHGIPKESCIALFDALVDNYDKTMSRLSPAEQEAVRRCEVPYYMAPIGTTRKTAHRAFVRMRKIGVLDFNEEGHVGITDRAHMHNPRFLA